MLLTEERIPAELVLCIHLSLKSPLLQKPLLQQVVNHEQHRPQCRPNCGFHGCKKKDIDAKENKSDTFLALFRINVNANDSRCSP